MLTCIACSKQLNNGSLQPQPNRDEDDVVATTPSRKQSIKALTGHIKGMAIKASGAYKNCKPCSRRRNEERKCADSDVNSRSGRFNLGYRRAGSFNSTPRGKGVSSGEGTPVSLSGRTESVVFIEEDEPREWVAQVEPGVLITFVSIPQGGNDLKRIQFSRELFNKLQAQKWWTENCEKVTELYNVQRLEEQNVPLPTPPYYEDEISKIGSAQGRPATPPLTKESLPRNFHRPKGIMGYSSPDSLEQQSRKGRHHDSCGLALTPKLSNISPVNTETTFADASVRSSTSREADHSGEFSVSNASDAETEWVEQDVPGVYITIRALLDGTRELRRVRFSRERFGERQARVWWEENKARIQEQYL